jgi:hypothetical protein
VSVVLSHLLACAKVATEDKPVIGCADACHTGHDLAAEESLERLECSLENLVRIALGTLVRVA